MRVPRGLLPAVRITAALSSNRMWDPSARPYSLAVRTITARTTSPFLTEPPGTACLTEATITSPTPAPLRPPATTRMHSSSRAPVLSATRRRDSCWIMASLSLPLAGACLADDGGDEPVLFLAQRSALGDLDFVAHVAGIVFVVRLEALGPSHGALVERMLIVVLDSDDDGLLHLVADDEPDLGLLQRRLPRRLGLHSHLPLSSRRVQLELALPRQEARDILAHLSDASSIREPAGCKLEAQVE